MPVQDYDHVAALYDPLLNPFLDPLRRSVTSLLLESHPRRVLDLCCGTGRQAILLHEAGLDVTGADLSPAMLAVARHNSPETIAYLEADATCTGLAEASFEAVLLSLALHELEEPTRQAILTEALRLLAPSGRLVVMDYRTPDTFSGKAMMLPVRAVERLAGRQHHACFRQFMQEGALAGLLDRAGLNATEVRTHMHGCIGIHTQVTG